MGDGPEHKAEVIYYPADLPEGPDAWLVQVDVLEDKRGRLFVDISLLVASLKAEWRQQREREIVEAFNAALKENPGVGKEEGNG